MEGKQNKLKGFGIAALIVLVVILAALIFVLTNRDNIITYYRLSTWNAAMITLAALFAAALICNALIQAVFYRERQKHLHEQAMNEAKNEEDAEEERRRKAKLSVRGDLDARTVKELLVEESRGRWFFAYEQIYECVEQMEQMDSYQDRLRNLLLNNGAEALSNSEDVLNQVEQYICRNVRNVLNFMEVADDDAADEVRVRLMKCKEENQKLLTQTRDFVYAMADFLNNQSGKADMRMLERYRDTILDSIREAGE